MDDLLKFGPLVLGVIVLGWNIWLVRQGARKEALTELGARIDAAADKLEARIIEAERAVESKAGRPWVEGLQNQLQDLAPRVQTLEVDSRHLPSGSEFHLLALKVEGMLGDMKVIATTLKTNTEITRRVEEFLLNEKAS